LLPAVLFWLACVPGGFTAVLLSGPEVRLDAPGQAIVSWSTDVPTRGTVRFGVRGEEMQASGPVTNCHEVTLGKLRAGQTYRYVIGTARQPLATNTFIAEWKSTPESPQRKPSKVTEEKAPPAKKTWGNYSTLQDHFDRHGPDFGAKDPEDYAAQAWMLLQKARREGLPVKVDGQGVIRVFDPANGAFGAYNRDHTTRTFFKPRSPSYFDRQPGQKKTLPPLP
jgi:hypothetical protein